MKYLALITVLFLSIGLHAMGDSLESVFFETSASHHAMGREGSGVADVWNSDPLMCFNNPALAAYQPGFSYSVIKYDIPKLLLPLGIEVASTYDAAAAVIGYKGMALILPAPAQNGEWGNYYDEGNEGVYDSHGYIIGTLHKFDAYRNYGLAINPLETYRAYKASYSPLLNHFDLAVGLSYIDIDSYTDFYLETGARAETGIYNMGLAAKARHTFIEYVNAEASFGLSRLNMGYKKVKYYPNQEEADPITKYMNTGFGLHLSLSSELIRIPVVSDFLKNDNLVSVKYLNGHLDFLDDDEIDASGIEFGLMDTIFLRQGSSDGNFSSSGDTSGWGLNLNIMDYASLRYNSASVFWDGPGDLDSYDLGINIDFMKMMGM